MTAAYQIARVFVVVGLLTGAFALLPSADSSDPYYATPLTIPDLIWTPLTGILQLDRYFPIHELLNIALLNLGIMVGMAGFFLVSWLAKRVLG